MPNCGVLYGASKTFKTWNLGLLAKHIFTKTHKPIRWVTADGGGYGPVMKLVNAGIIEPLSIGDDPQRMLLLQRIIDGYWPVDITEGKRTTKKVTNDISNVGGYIFEGVTSLAESLQRLYEGRTTGMKPAYSESLKSDLIDDKGTALANVTIGGFSQDSYGIIQNLMQKFLNYSWQLPVPYIWWSGHEASAEDDISKKVVRGLKVVGDAATPRIGKDIAYMIHSYRVETGSKIVNGRPEKTFETRYYFQSHLDNTIPNVFWEASSRAAGDDIPRLLEKFPGGYFVPKVDSGLDVYMQTEEELLAQGSDDLAKWKESILGDKK